ncbi:UPF0606 protein KIAA1549-like isoform X4 [Nerophis ophidion]|uniref:UPF0606 protein KIAA1549-like isoform X4 n=1 Tax=Nerophis ophidion TaxID=159077 RepID=UPI002ADF016D|nr:UPF0606 protein KIAA1549-like isoform X4 [Nerophis ophidion]
MAGSCMDVRGHCAVVLGMVLLINMIAADSPVADVSLSGSTHHAKGFIDDISSPRGVSISPSSPFLAFEDPDTPGTQQVIPESRRESFTPIGLNAKEPQHLSPSLHRSQPVLESFVQLQASKRSRINSAEETSILLRTHSISQMPTQSNVAKPSTFTRSTVLQLSFVKDLAKDAQGNESENILTTASSLPIETFKPLDFSDSPSDKSFILDHVLRDAKLHMNNSNKMQHVNQMIPSSALMPENQPVTILPHSHEILAPSHHVPLIGLHLTSPLSEPIEAPLEDFYPANTMDFDWGSGDYLETMAFLNPEEEDYFSTKVPDTYDQEDNTEQYNTEFPSRVGTSFSSLHHLHSLPSLSLMTAYATHLPKTSIDPSSLSSFNSTVPYTLEVTPTISSEIIEASDKEWPDTISIQPTDVLLPDMNSLEYYTTQLTKENSVSGGEAEQRGNITVVPISTPDTAPSNSITNDIKLTDNDRYSDFSDFESLSKTTVISTTELFNVSKPFLHHSIATTSFLDPPSPIWTTPISTTDWSAGTHTVDLQSSAVILPSTTVFWPNDVMSSLSLMDVQWFVTESFPQSTIHATPVFTATTTYSSSPTEHSVINTTEQVFNITPMSSNSTLVPPVMLGDQGVTKDEFDNPATMTLIPTNSANITPPIPTSPNANTSFHQEATGITVNVTPVTSGEKQTTALTFRQYLCNLEKPEYLIKIGFPSGVSVGHAKSQVREILKHRFNKAVELQVIEPPPKFVFRVVSGPAVYTAISVVNALRRSGHRFLSVSPNWVIPDNKYQVHTVLQFVPDHINVRFCNFSESIERGLTMAFAEVLRRVNMSANFTVHIKNISMTVLKNQRLGRSPVDITFTVHNSRGYLMGSEVSNALMKLTKVEFSYYMGYPVFQIAEPFHYPKLNTSQFLRSSWVRTVFLGVLDSEVGQRTFQANIERRVAMLLAEAMGLVRRVKRATSVGNSSVQVVTMNRMVGMDHPLEVVYFVEGSDGQRVPAVKTADILNSLDVQKAAIILGYRVQGILAQPVEKMSSLPSDTENPNVWIIIGVVIPLLVVIIIISILYWKLCRTDKLEFQPDAMASIQQRQKSATSQSPVHMALPQHESGVQFSEEEDDEFEEEEEDYEDEEEENEEDNNVEMGKSKNSTPSDEEEDGEKEEKKENTKRASGRAFKPGQEYKAALTKSKEMKKEEGIKVFPKGRRVQEELQAPSVKGFDFAKLHLGQQNKDDVTVVQESISAGPLPMSDKEGPCPSQNGEGPAPISKNSASSTKASRSSRRRERISPSDGDSMVSDRSSGRESTEENLRAQATPSDSKQTRKAPINVLNGPPPMNGLSEQLSSTSIFEHVDRMSRPPDTSRRLPNKVQLIAMQPMSVPHLHSNTAAAKLPDLNQMNKEVQVALRQKSEIEHHRNKIRLRAKRKGHYDFPAMDDIDSGLGDAKDQDHIYQKAQMQMDKIMDHNAQNFTEPQKSARRVRSPKQQMKEQSKGKIDADKDHLISEDTDPVYRKYPGVNNVAFVPSIEEARQQMRSLLDGAFALVSPTSQGSSAGVTLPGVNVNPSDTSPPDHGPRSWGLSYQGLGSYTGRFSDLSVSPPLLQGPMPRQDHGLSYLPPGEATRPGEQVRIASHYSSRGLYADESPTSARPRPVGGTTGSQLHHLTQVGLTSRMNGYPAGVRGHPGQNGGMSWSNYRDDSYCRTVPDNAVSADTEITLFVVFLSKYSLSSVYIFPYFGFP